MTEFEGQKSFAAPLDVKMLTDDGEFEGYASTYGNVDDGADIVRSGAFDESLRTKPVSKIKMLRGHKTNDLIGTWSNIVSDTKGLFVKGKLLLNTLLGKETYELMKAGALDAMSIGYRTCEVEYDSGNQIRTITRADLFEVSVVTFAMNDQAIITGVKSNDIKTIREFEVFLRDEGGFSHEAAKAVAISGFKTLDPRDEANADGSSDITALNQLARVLRGNHEGT